MKAITRDERIQHWQRNSTNPSNIIQYLHELAISYNYTDISIVTRWLIRRLRELISPASQRLLTVSMWDEQFAFLLVKCYFHMKPSLQTLKRFLYYVIQTDFALETVQIESSQYQIIAESNLVLDAFTLYHEAIDCFTSLHSDEPAVSGYSEMLSKDPILSHLFDGHHNPHLIHELLISAKQIHPFVLPSFIKRGLNLSHIPEYEETILHTAARSFHHNLIAMIVEESYSLVTCRDPCNGFTPIQTLCRTISICNWEVLISTNTLCKMIADLLGSHLQLIWDCTFLHRGEMISASDASPLYRAIATNNKAVIEIAVKFASTVSKDLRDQVVMRHCVHRLIAVDNVEAFVYYVDAFSLQQNYKEYLAYAIRLRSSKCFRYLINESLKESSSSSSLKHNYPSNDYPLLHLAILSDFRASLPCALYDYHDAVASRQHTTIVSFSKELLLSYETMDTVKLLGSVTSLQSDTSAPSESEHTTMPQLSSVMSAISFAAYLNEVSFLVLIKNYCKRFALPKQILLNSIDGVNPLSACLLGNSQDCLSFYRDNFTIDDISSRILVRGR
jgi:hypothetical protein